MVVLRRVMTKSGRHYRVPGFERAFPSVTTVLGVIDKPALVPWSTKVTLQAVEQELLAQPHPSPPPQEWLGGVLERARSRHKDVLHQAGHFGTLAHQAIDDAICGVPCSVELDRPLRNVVEGFAQWRESAGLRLTGDSMVFSERYGYAGAMDALGIGRTDGSIAVVDFKTSNGIYDSHLLQVAAYAKAYEEMHNKRVSHGYVVRFDRNQPRFEAHAVADLDHAFNVFKAALFLFRALNAQEGKWGPVSGLGRPL